VFFGLVYHIGVLAEVITALVPMDPYHAWVFFTHWGAAMALFVMTALIMMDIGFSNRRLTLRYFAWGATILLISSTATYTVLKATGVEAIHLQVASLLLYGTWVLVSANTKLLKIGGGLMNTQLDNQPDA
jgi:hypothetical protein